MSSSEEEEFDLDEEEEEEELQADEEDDDDDAPLSDLKRPKPKVNYAEDNDDNDDNDDESDSDDDIPLAALKSPAKKKKAPAPKKKKATKAKPTKAKAKKPSLKKKSSSVASIKNGKYKSCSEALYLSESKKGLLIQRILSRWWYAMTWPDPSALPEKPPKHYDTLDGFPGVYVCSSGDEVGKIMDLRDPKKCPNFNNLVRKDSEELREILLKALEGQKKALIEAEGSGTSTEKGLDKLIKWATKLSPKSTDSEAAKVLKAAKLSLD